MTDLDPNTEAFERLGAEVASLQDGVLDARNDLHDVRSRLLKAHKPQRRWSMLWLALPTAVVAAWVLFVGPSPDALTASVDGAPVVAGTWVGADGEARTLGFSDGSEVEVAAQSGVRVAALSAQGAELDLQRGSARVSVVHHDARTRWRVHAGPFDVHVVGTQFDVAWDPRGERFALHLVEGRVVIEGPTIARRTVEAGETVTVELPERRMEVVQGPSEEEHLGWELDPIDIEGTVQQPRVRTPNNRLRIDWRDLAREARYAEALAAVNWDRELATGTAGDLLLLADTARLGRQPRRAQVALTAIRTRFEATPEAAQAAFRLGRLALASQPADAAAWFERALAEDPSGPYAAVAAGRRMEAYDRAGNEIAAGRAARAYLNAHPRGAHSDAARALLERAAPAPFPGPATSPEEPIATVPSRPEARWAPVD